MDQLKLVLEHKFWILTALAVLLPPIGWWQATNRLAADAKTRTATVEGAFKAVPDVNAPGVKFPNADWTKAATQTKDSLTALIGTSQRRLFERQRRQMHWPATVQEYLDKSHTQFRKPEGQSKEFVTNFMIAKQLFTDNYDDDWRNSLNIIEPLVPGKSDGKVLLASYLDITRYAVSQWQVRLLFTKEQMENAQEDLWLMEAVLQAINGVNKGTTQISDARIKVLRELKLRGGSLTDLNDRRSGTQSTPGAQPGAAPGAAPAPPRVSHDMSMGGVGGGGPASIAAQKSKTFDADDFFGADGSKASVYNTSEKGRDTPVAPEGARYVENVPGKYRTRGFVLRVVMDERAIPTLLSELSKSPFPLQIKDVEHGPYDYGASDRSRVVSNMTGQIGAPGAPVAVTNANAPQKEEELKTIERIDLALNQNYLAEVIVAGLFTIYDDPDAAAAQTIPSSAKPVAGAKVNVAPAPAKGLPKAAPATPAGAKPPQPATGKGAPPTPRAVTPVPAAPIASPASRAAAKGPAAAAPAATDKAPQPTRK